MWVPQTNQNMQPPRNRRQVGSRPAACAAAALQLRSAGVALPPIVLMSGALGCCLQAPPRLPTSRLRDLHLAPMVPGRRCLLPPCTGAASPSPMHRRRLLRGLKVLAMATWTRAAGASSCVRSQTQMGWISTVTEQVSSFTQPAPQGRPSSLSSHRKGARPPHPTRDGGFGLQS